MNDLLRKAYNIAASADVITPRDKVVLYSISYQKTDINKQRALHFMRDNPQYMMLDNTPCGQQLIALGLETGNNPSTEILKIWALASQRFIAAASGNITAFVENADKRSTFRSVELPEILRNEQIKTVNNIDKFVFARQFAK